jgi:hypothetical protein
MLGDLFGTIHPKATMDSIDLALTSNDLATFFLYTKERFSLNYNAIRKAPSRAYWGGAMLKGRKFLDSL